MAFKMKGYSYPGKSPLKQKGNDDNRDNYDDQSKDAARRRGDLCAVCDKLKGNCTCEGGPKNQEQKEDAAGVAPNIKTPKVMKDGYVNPTQKKKIADEKARFNALTPAQKKAEQDAANEKADKFHKRGKYKQ